MRSALTIFMALWVSAAAAAQSDDLARRSREASAEMKAGRFDNASRIYRELLKALPDDAGLLMNLGMSLAMGGHEADALAPLERAIELKPGLIPAHLFLGTSYLALGQPERAIAPLKRVVAAQPAEIEHRRALASAYAGLGRNTEAITELRRITELAPRLPDGWYALGHAYNAAAQDAMGTFGERPEDAPWKRLLVADALFDDGRLTDAFALYRESLEALPTMVTIRDSVARIYEQTDHRDWAVRERAGGVLSPAECARRKALCEFRAGRFRSSLAAALARSDPESRYWRVRAATELARAAFKRLDALPDSRERREVRATLAMSSRRYVDAIAELQVALKFSPGDPSLIDDLGTAYYLSRNCEQALATLAPLREADPDNARRLTMAGDCLVQLQRIEDALPLLRRAVERSPDDPTPRLTLGRAYVQHGDFAAAIPLIEPLLASDQDGSLHVQLGRAYAGIGQREKAEALLKKSQEIQQAAQERSNGTGQRTITPPK
jgi:predicted Zn-dependent protease